MKPDLGMVEISFHRAESGGLPGWEAQKKMMPSFRGSVPHEDDLSPASVLICLMEREGELVFPLIRRSTADGDRHSGQISLPGGRQEHDEELLETAYREAWEEIGVPRQTLRLLGSLSPLPIPVSGHLVYPFTAFCPESFSYSPDSREVDEVFDIPVRDLISPDNIKIEDCAERSIPFFKLHGQVVWGATAMILSEFRELLRG